MGGARSRTFAQLTDEANALQCVAMILNQNGRTILPASGGVEALMVVSTLHSKIEMLTDS